MFTEDDRHVTPQGWEEIECKIQELKRERLLLETGRHPVLEKRLEELRERSENEMERNDIQYELQYEEIERNFRHEILKLEAERDNRCAENEQILLREIDEKWSEVEAESESMEISGAAHHYPFLICKRGLRSRRTPDSSNQPNEGRPNKKSKTTLGAAINFLLTEQQIADDLALIVPEALQDDTPTINVSVDGGKLMYGGKMYSKYTPLVIKTTACPPFSGIITQITDNTVILRANTSGDTRMIVCTLSDFEHGLVHITKATKH